MKFKLLKENKIPVFIDAYRGLDDTLRSADGTISQIVFVNDTDGKSAAQSVSDAVDSNAEQIAGMGDISSNMFKKALDKKPDGDKSRHKMPGESDETDDDSDDNSGNGWGSYYKDHKTDDTKPTESDDGDDTHGTTPTGGDGDDIPQGTKPTGGDTPPGTKPTEGSGGDAPPGTKPTGGGGDPIDGDFPEGGGDQTEGDGGDQTEGDDSGSDSEDDDNGSVTIYHSLKDPTKKYIRIGDKYKEI